ncbi:MAG: hypothetical protein KAR79_03585 [Simkaniaceae bacterium]|nr:hypothetical protein [Simkaniaceae bacterium]
MAAIQESARSIVSRERNGEWVEQQCARVEKLTVSLLERGGSVEDIATKTKEAFRDLGEIAGLSLEPFECDDADFFIRCVEQIEEVTFYDYYTPQQVQIMKDEALHEVAMSKSNVPERSNLLEVVTNCRKKRYLLQNLQLVSELCAAIARASSVFSKCGVCEESNLDPNFIANVNEYYLRVNAEIIDSIDTLLNSEQEGVSEIDLLRAIGYFPEKLFTLEELQFQIWILLGAPGGVDLSSILLLDNKEKIPDALRNICREKVRALSDEDQNKLDGLLYEISKQRCEESGKSFDTFGDSNWGRNHRYDDVEVFFEAFLAVTDGRV